MNYIVTKNISSSYADHFLEDISSIDWTSCPVNQAINIGPFKIEIDLHIDQKSILNSYFIMKVDVKVPFVGVVNVIDGRIDKNNTKLETSFGHMAGAAIIFYKNLLVFNFHSIRTV